MAQTLGTSGIFFDETDDSPTFDGNIGQASFKAIQTGLINYSDINPIVSYLMGPTLVFGELFGVLAGAPFPDNALLRCIDYKIRPADQIIGASSGGVNLHGFAFITIIYSNIKAQPNQNQTQDPVPMLTHEGDIGGEFVVPHGLAMQWDTDATPAGQDTRAGILVPTEEVSIIWPRVPTPPFYAIRALRGKINNVDIIFDTGTFPFETALFLGAKYRRDFMSDGTLSWQLTYRFSQRQVPAADVGNTVDINGNLYQQTSIGGWNHYFRPSYSKPGFYRLKYTQSVAGSKTIYRLGDFSALFRSDQTLAE